MYYISTFHRNNRYSRNSAINYALTYGLKPNSNYRYFPLINGNGGDCTNFVSQSLLAGGAQMESSNKWSWWYRHLSSNQQNAWSISWAVAHSLYYYLRVNAEKNSTYTKGIELADKNDLELGDLIFFENNNGLIFHSSIVTSFSLGEPLITQHSYERMNIPYEKSRPGIKYHFIKIVIWYT